MLKSQWVDCVIAIVSFIVVLVSLTVSYHSDNWHWFSRAGAILVLGGVVLEYRNADFIKDGKNSFRYTTVRGMGALEIGGRSKVFLKWNAHAMVIGGTFIAGYGDLLGLGSQFTVNCGNL